MIQPASQDTRASPGDNLASIPFEGAYTRPLDPTARAYTRDVAAYVVGRALLDNGGAPSLLRLSRDTGAAHETGHAVIAACNGYLPDSVQIWKARGRWCGGTLNAVENPGARSAEAGDLANSVRIMCGAASGYVGERVLWKESMLGAAPELGLVLYMAQQVEATQGIPAAAVLRATLTECELCLEENREAASRLRDLLLEKHQATKAEIAGLLGGVTKRGPTEWLATALTVGGRSYPEVERLLRIAAHFAKAALAEYVEPTTRRDAAVTGIGLAGA